jgi:hypothetical protein
MRLLLVEDDRMIGESRWLRPCAAHEKPGLQEGKQ